MSVPEGYERYAKIAELLGFTLEVTTEPCTPFQLFWISHEPSHAQLSLRSNQGEAVLDFLNACRWAATNQELEERVAKLERQLNANNHGGTPAQSQAEYERYLEYFQQKIPEFEAAGITLIIDEQERKVAYMNSSKRAGSNHTPILYNISRSGYSMAVNALRAQYKRNYHTN